MTNLWLLKEKVRNHLRFCTNFLLKFAVANTNITYIYMYLYIYIYIYTYTHAHSLCSNHKNTLALIQSYIHSLKHTNSYSNTRTNECVSTGT